MGGGGKTIPFESTLSFNVLERSFFIHLVDGEFLKLMSKEDHSFLWLLRMKSLPYVIWWFTWNPCVHVLK